MSWRGNGGAAQSAASWGFAQIPVLKGLKGNEGAARSAAQGLLAGGIARSAATFTQFPGGGCARSAAPVTQLPGFAQL